MYEVTILKEGYNEQQGPGHQKACGTITLLKGAKNIIVDTGNPWDKDLILKGDLFECKEDLENPSLWQDNSEKPDAQEQSRINILRIADYIVPGHGEMFKVPEAYKRQLRVVMYYEEIQETTGAGKSESTTLEYVVMEDD